MGKSKKNMKRDEHVRARRTMYLAFRRIRLKEKFYLYFLKKIKDLKK